MLGLLYGAGLQRNKVHENNMSHTGCRRWKKKDGDRGAG